MTRCQGIKSGTHKLKHAKINGLMKTQEIPQYLIEFNKIFNQFEYKYPMHTVWNDFLDLCICGLSYGILEARRKEIFASYREEYHSLLWQPFEVLLRLHAEAKKEGTWIDPLGDYYEALSSSGHKQGFGQFFTPNCICDAMVMMTVANDKPKGCKNLDPTCGSGRMLLSFDNKFPNNYQFGCDLDKTCVMMTAINLCLQGAKGEVCWKDALNLNDHRVIYAVNLHSVNDTNLPTIVEITKEDSFIYRHDMALLQSHLDKETSVPNFEKPKKVVKIQPQTSLF
jgi:type I restriction enzyme M protein